MRCGIGLDIGGSSAKIALVSDQGVILAHENAPVVASEDAEAILTPWAEAINRLRALAAQQALQVIALGCGVPGYLDPTRTFVDLSNVRGLDGFALGPWLRDRSGLPVVLDNDACMAAIAETAQADAMDMERTLFVTVGSGIGVVLVVDGSVVRVTHGVTGDAAHILVDHKSEERCPIGCRGCLETVASARAIARAGTRAAQEGVSAPLAAVLRERGEVSGTDVSLAAAAGDAVAAGIISQVGRWLGIGLASWAAIYAPDLVVLGGGVAQASDDWLAAATRSMSEVGVPEYVGELRVRRARLGNHAGVIGAVLTALREISPT